MKITKSVSFETEVEINLSGEDITCALASLDEPERPGLALIGINTCGQFLKSVPDEIIAELLAPQRKTITDFLLAQAARFEEIAPPV